MADESSRRVQRVEKQIKEILATHLIREFQHHVDGLITISKVRISPDLKHGRIYLRVLGPTFAQAKIQQSELFDELKERHAEIQRFLGKSLDTKFIPKLEFFYDDTLEEVLKIEETLKKLADERKTQIVEGNPDITAENEHLAVRETAARDKLFDPALAPLVPPTAGNKPERSRASEKFDHEERREHKSTNDFKKERETKADRNNKPDLKRSLKGARKSSDDSDSDE